MMVGGYWCYIFPTYFGVLVIPDFLSFLSSAFQIALLQRKEGVSILFFLLFSGFWASRESMLGGLFFFFWISLYTFFLLLNNQGLWVERHEVPKRGLTLFPN